MARNKKKFAFIISVNDENFFEECVLYINHLRLPYGFTAEIVPVMGAQSMAAAYNIGMSRTDAQYKVYLHQDVFIINPNFMNDVLAVFKQSWKIALIGMIGSPRMPGTGIQSHGERIGNVYSPEVENIDFEGYEYHKEDGLYEVQAIDGMIMITKEDIPWREDIFDGWELYDSSQSFEFKRRGYRVVVPEQKIPWVAHENGGIKSLWNVDKYRRAFIDEYLINQ